MAGISPPFLSTGFGLGVEIKRLRFRKGVSCSQALCVKTVELIHAKYYCTGRQTSHQARSRVKKGTELIRDRKWRRTVGAEEMGSFVQEDVPSVFSDFDDIMPD